MHHVGWPDNDSRAAATGWLADMVAVANIGDGRAGVPYHDLCGTTLAFVTLGEDLRDLQFSMGQVTEAAWGRYLAAMKEVMGTTAHTSVCSAYMHKKIEAKIESAPAASSSESRAAPAKSGCSRPETKA